MPWIKQVGCDCANCGASPCATGCCDLNISPSGGDAGYDVTHDLVTGGSATGVASSLDIDYNMESLKDRLQVYLNGSGSAAYDTGCVSGTGGTILSIPVGSTTARFVITPHCEGGSGTVWDFSAVCSVP